MYQKNKFELKIVRPFEREISKSYANTVKQDTLLESAKDDFAKLVSSMQVLMEQMSAIMHAFTELLGTPAPPHNIEGLILNFKLIRSQFKKFKKGVF